MTTRCFRLYVWKYFIIIYSLTFCFNPVDTQCCFNAYSTSVRRRMDVETTSCLYREGDLSCVIGAVKANLRGLHPNVSNLWNLFSLKCIIYLHTIVLLRRHGFPWKGCNFHRLKDIFREYSIKYMKDLLS